MLGKKIYYTKLNKYRQRIEQHLIEFISTITDPQIKEMLGYALESGRRFRPLLLILAHKVFQKNIPEKIFKIAATTELLHKASLIHDDLLDGDQYRRGQESFYRKYGERKALIVGDLLSGMAFENFLQLVDHPYLITQWSKLYRQLAMGELKDLVLEHHWQTDRETVLEMIYGKTASFLEFVMKSGTYLATSDVDLATEMGKIGVEMGFAFQIVNDLNNWRGLEKELGRIPKADIDTGKVNLVTQLINNFHSDKPLSSAEYEKQISSEVKTLAKEHIELAEKLLRKINMHNKYTEILLKIFQEFDQEWFWVDRDDK